MRNIRRLLGTILCLLTLWRQEAVARVFLTVPPADWRDRDTLRITAFAVGEGDALLLQCGGESMMVDGGPEKFRMRLKEGLTSRNITHLKYLLNTHNHDDHINGLYHLMQMDFSTDAYLHPYAQRVARHDFLQQRAIAMARKKGIPIQRVGDGDELTLGQSQLHLYRYADLPNANAKSLMIRVDFDGSSALLCADIIGDTQKYFAANLPPEALKADVIKIPHHGITPVATDFLNVVNPEFALITNYNDEKRLHKIISQMNGRDIPALFSGEGNVTLETDGQDWYIWQSKPKSANGV